MSPSPPMTDPSVPWSPPPLQSARRLLADSRKLRVLVLSSDTGGGHRASAAALSAALRHQLPTSVQVHIVDFWVELARGPFRRFPAQYTFLANHPSLWNLTYQLTRFPPARALTESYFNAFAHRNVRDAFIKYQPDLVISVHPLVNTLSLKVLNQLAVTTAVPRPTFVTVVTDLGSAHPTWFNSQADMVYVPTPAVASLAYRMRIPESRIKAVGLPLRQQFWNSRPPKLDLRAKLGMHLHAPAILLVGGGDGIGGLRNIATTLLHKLPKKLQTSQMQLVIICGKNERLRQWLSSQTWGCKLFALGYVDNMSEWMTACDMICTKAGPGTIAEAMICGLPIIISSFLPGQEEANVRYVLEEGVGVYAKKADKIASVAAEWIANPEKLREMSQRATLCGRPDATTAIVRDIIEVTKAKIAKNIAEMERLRRVQEASAMLAGHPIRQFLPYLPVMRHDSRQSHLFTQVRFLLTIVAGSMLTHRGLSFPSALPAPHKDLLEDSK